MRYGYACINLTLSGGFMSCILKTAREKGTDYIRFLAVQNFRRVREIMLWNAENGIHLYRLSSDLIPFGSHPISDGWSWWEDETLNEVASDVRKIADENDIRITIHPGQFNNLSSDSATVVKSTFRDVEFQTRLLKIFGGSDLILHVGGKYEGKTPSIQRFKAHYQELSEDAKSVLRLENDDKSYNIDDVLNICYDLSIKPMFDYHHNICLPSTDMTQIKLGLLRLWKDQRVKIHLSSGRSYRADRSHSDYISNETWEEFYRDFSGWDIDVMIEAKQKDRAALVAQLLYQMGSFGSDGKKS